MRCFLRTMFCLLMVLACGCAAEEANETGDANGGVNVNVNGEKVVVDGEAVNVDTGDVKVDTSGGGVVIQTK